MWTTKLAYRLPDGQVEGFKGQGFSKPASRQDCLNQINRKLQIIAAARGTEIFFDHARLIETAAGLTPAERSQVRADWKCALRY